MKTPDAIELIRAAIPPDVKTWADLGAGDGTFTKALVGLLGRDARVYAVDRDERALAALGRWAAEHAPGVIPVVADYSRPFDLPGAGEALDGMLLGNSLHYIEDAATVLARLATRLRPGGRVVLIEYDGRSASPWVPFPIPTLWLPALAASAGLSRPVITATRPSDYGGDIYVAIAELAANGIARATHRENSESRSRSANQSG